MIEYLKYFFDPHHLFSVRPGAMQARAVLILLVIFAGLIVAGIIIKTVGKKTPDILKVKGLERVFHLTLTIGLLGLIYLFFAWQGIPLLAARFWLLIIIITMVVWLIFILKYLLVQAPKQRQTIKQKRQFEKYLP